MDLSSDRSAEDRLRIAQWFDGFLADVLDGRPTAVDSLLDEHPRFAKEISDSYVLAHRVAGRRVPSIPSIPGYEIVRELGRGGMGAVFLARHADLGRLVALKVLPGTFGISERSRSRFLTEARALAQVADENIVRIHNVIANGDAMAFEMEWIDGPTLRQVAERLRGRKASVSELRGLFPGARSAFAERTILQWFVRVIATIARALEKVHRAGLVHRDVKPSNILLRQDGTPLLADFGLVRDSAMRVSQSGAFIGTLVYAPPEQLQAADDRVDARSDVYSLAATLWELVVGAPPYEGRNAVDLLQRIEHAGAPRLRKVVADAPRDLETILGKALDPDPERRYASAAAFADDLDRLLRWQPIDARPPSVWQRTIRHARRQRRVLIAAAAGAACVVGILIAIALVQGENSRRATEVGRLLRVAHENLLSPSVHERAFRQIVLGTPLEAEQFRATDRIGADGLSRALAALDRAHELAPDRRDVAVERALVVAAMGGRGESDVGPGLRRADDGEIADLTAGVREHAVRVLRGQLALAVDPKELESQALEQRLEIGLLAFLIGDLPTCERAWSVVDPLAGDAPFVDAALGMLYAIDARDDRAYARLLQAAHSFPENAQLAATLAEVAISVGDHANAGRWIERAERLGAPASDLAVARAELRAAGGDRTPPSETLLETGGPDSSIAWRVTALAARLGDGREARRRLEFLIAEFPRAMRARVLLGRTALARHEWPGYLAQVEACLDGPDEDRQPTDCGELLALGGLQGLLGSKPDRDLVEPDTRGSHGEDASRAVRSLEVAWVSASSGGPGPPVSGLADLLLRRREFRRDLSERFPHSGGRVGAIAATLARAVAVASWFPEWGMALRADQRWFLGFAALGVRSSWTAITNRILPALCGEGDSGIRGRVFLAFDGELAGQAMGAAASIGDVDRDGVGDYLVGTVASRDGGLARVHSGADGRILHAMRGPVVGYAVAGVGDLDRDGAGDFAVSSVQPDGAGVFSGHVAVRSGTDSRILLDLIPESPSETFGSTIAGLGDVDGDGIAEIAVGDMGELGGQGSVSVMSGADGHVVTTVHGPRASSFGVSLAATADHDGDGANDLIVGAFGAAAGRGRAWVFSSRSGCVLYELEGGPTARAFGAAVAAGTDLDGDGIADFAVGAPHATNGGIRSGVVFLFSGRDGHRIAQLAGERQGSAFGWAVAVGDVDGDGCGDVIVGAPNADLGGRRAGALHVCSGRAIRDGADRDFGLSVYGEFAGEQLGVSITYVADRLGDGRPALLVGSPQSPANGPGSGRIWLLDPSPHGTAAIRGR